MQNKPEDFFIIIFLMTFFIILSSKKKPNSVFIVRSCLVITPQSSHDESRYVMMTHRPGMALKDQKLWQLHWVLAGSMCAHQWAHSGPVVRLEFLNSCLINYLGTRNNNISDFGGPHILIIIQAIIYSLKMQDIYMDRSYTKLNRSNICIMGAAMATFLGSSSSTYMWVKWALAHHRESGSKHFFSRA